ncbi:hypothetical protein [Aeromicrobium sp. Root472D3]|uniref:hypothetical protein n=1 Tax=Aeromicrobium sp. Root472D3 TaxID=1736540 RepID=UPI0006F83006|nr:hypothetical protein [Aeromicrobium sp. Root472D3]KQX74237.1 hypothetical protein ASD10_03025 [Aeromicrobium sp. Root472D3]
MRSSLLSRALIAVASSSVASAALAVAPATAATPSGTTRDAVLSLASAARADASAPSRTTRTAAAQVLTRECGLASGESVDVADVNFVRAVTPIAGVDGVYLDAEVRNGLTVLRECALGLVAPTADGATLTGTATLDVVAGDSIQQAPSVPLSGDVSVIVLTNATRFSDGFSYTATGRASRTVTTTTTDRVRVEPTANARTRARNTYDASAQKARKAYKKAVEKADGSARKKASAKRAYRARIVAARTTYAKAVAPRLVTRTRTSAVTQFSDFTVVAKRTAPAPPAQTGL